MKKFTLYDVYMQRKSYKTLQIIKKLGKIIKEKRQGKNISCTELAYGFDIDKGNLSRIENGLIDCKITTLWRISEALGLKPSKLINILEKSLGKDFKLSDEN